MSWENIARGKRSCLIRKGNKVKKVFLKEFRGGIEIEAKFLKLMSKKDISPSVISVDSEGIVMDFAEGILLKDFLMSCSKKNLIDILIKILDICRKLDKMGINKMEMNHPGKHIIIGKKILLVDFERARFSENPKNVRQFVSFIGSGFILEKLDIENRVDFRKKIEDLAEKYKKDAKVYEKIVSFLRQ